MNVKGIIFQRTATFSESIEAIMCCDIISSECCCLMGAVHTAAVLKRNNQLHAIYLVLLQTAAMFGMNKKKAALLSQTLNNKQQ